MVVSPNLADSLIIFGLVGLTGLKMWIQSKEHKPVALDPDIEKKKLEIDKLRLEREINIATADLMRANKLVGVEGEAERKHRF